MALLGPITWRHSLAAGFVIIATVLLTAGPDAGADLAATPMAEASPRATPRATPTAGGCGNEASGPVEIAEVFVAAATRMDLERASRCFAPDRQPATWDDVFLGGLPGTPDDISACRGVPYVVIESKLRSDLSAIIFLFDRACVIASLDDWQRDLYDTDTLPVATLVAQVHRSEGRWYVQDAFAVVPD
ncbi:MAG: hypothetical protein M3464_20885 [Chloroflexota bacterium]|nr:hypothetical protein [Chloroflexota bacterium]